MNFGYLHPTSSKRFIGAGIQIKQPAQSLRRHIPSTCRRLSRCCRKPMVGSLSESRTRFSCKNYTKWPKDVRTGEVGLFSVIVAQVRSDPGKCVPARGSHELALRTGKSMFLWYALVCLLKQKHAVLFHWRRTTYLFYLGEVYLPKYQDHPDWCPRAINGQIIWSLLDVDMEATEPPPKLTVNSGSLFPIQASSHSRTRYKYWERRACPEKYGMPLWDKQELLLG